MTVELTPIGKLLPLKDVATLQRGFDLPVQNRTEGSVPIYAANGPVGTHNKSKVHGPGVVTGRSGSIGKVHYVEGNYWPLNTSLYVKDFHGNHPKFIYYLLQNMRLERYHEGTGVPTLNRNNVHSILVRVPPLDEQRRIADILDRADALRAKRRAAIQKLDTLTQSIFIEMFGDPATNPKGFSTCKLGDIINFVGGSQPPRTTFTFTPGTDTVRLVQIRDFKSDKFKTYIPQKYAKRSFEKDDVMIARYGPPVFQILRGLEGSYNVALIKAEPREGVCKDFIFSLLQEQRLHSYIVAQSERTAGQTGVNLQTLEAYPAFKPPIKLQTLFSSRVNATEQLKNEYKQSLRLLNANFNSLQNLAFGGQTVTTEGLIKCHN